MQAKVTSEIVDTEVLKKELAKLDEQVERYNRGYGAGAFSLEQLKNYTFPLQEKINQIKAQIANATSESSHKKLEIPSKQDMQAFATKARKTLHDLKFEAKRAIILNTVEKVVGNRDRLQVIGYIPVNQNVKQLSLHRHSRPAKRRQVNAV